MDWSNILVGVLSGTGGTVLGRLWSTRLERGQDYERLIKLYREEVERCNKQCAELQQKMLIYIQENIEFKNRIEQQEKQIEIMDSQINTLEHEIEKLKK